MLLECANLVIGCGTVNLFVNQTILCFVIIGVVSIFLEESLLGIRSLRFYCLQSKNRIKGLFIILILPNLNDHVLISVGNSTVIG